MIQELLGHKSSKTTEIYTHVSQKALKRIQSPLDRLLGVEGGKKEKVGIYEVLRIDEIDYRNTIQHIDTDRRQWLNNALKTVYGEHQWIINDSKRIESNFEEEPDSR